jgi:3'(2'), 5'-bisphosphate nucleotidase
MTIYNEYLKIAIESAISAGNKTIEFFNQDIDVLNKEDNSPLTLADLEANQIIINALKPIGIPILSEENKQIPYSARKDWKQFWLVDPLDGTKEFIHKSPEYTINVALIENNFPVIGVVYAPVLKDLYFASVEAGSYKISSPGNTKFELIKQKADHLPFPKNNRDKTIIVASKSHMNDETIKFIDTFIKIKKDYHLLSIGSSLKLCMIAEGKADIYPRLGPTMEWDIAASQAIAEYAGCKVISIKNGNRLTYNKKELLNPWFIVYTKDYEAIIEKII